jgi:hypothetical protein
VFRKRVLRRIFRPERDEITGQWRILHNEELTGLYCLTYIILVIKSRSMRWAGHVARMGGEVRTGFWWGNVRKRDHLEDPGVEGMIILRWNLRKWGGGMDWIDLAQDRGRWQALVNAVMNLRVPQNEWNFLTS